ncbi:uncharacterized, partial [Tachysurus ichikawai]
EASAGSVLVSSSSETRLNSSSQLTGRRKQPPHSHLDKRGVVLEHNASRFLFTFTR